MHEMFSAHITPEKFENAKTNLKHLRRLRQLCLRKTWEGKSRDYRDIIVFEDALETGGI